MGDNDVKFDSKSLTFRIQKKLASQMSKKAMVKIFIDDTTSLLLDDVYNLVKKETGSKKEAEKLVKNLLKIIIKVGILYKSDHVNNEEIRLAEEFQKKFHKVAVTVVSFCEVDFSFDREFLAHQLKDCEAIIHKIIQRHLTVNSHKHVTNVFGFFLNGQFLDKLFQKNGIYESDLKDIGRCLNILIEDGEI